MLGVWPLGELKMNRVQREVSRLSKVGSKHIDNGDWESWRYWLDDFIGAIQNWRDGFVSPGFEDIKKDFNGWSNQELSSLIVGLRKLEIGFELDKQRSEIDSLSQEIDKIHKSIEGASSMLDLAKKAMAEVPKENEEQTRKTGSD